MYNEPRDCHERGMEKGNNSTCWWPTRTGDWPSGFPTTQPVENSWLTRRDSSFSVSSRRDHVTPFLNFFKFGAPYKTQVFQVRRAHSSVKLSFKRISVNPCNADFLIGTKMFKLVSNTASHLFCFAG